jgi:hypothetical protein
MLSPCTHALYRFSQRQILKIAYLLCSKVALEFKRGGLSTASYSFESPYRCVHYILAYTIKVFNIRKCIIIRSPAIVLRLTADLPFCP